MISKKARTLYSYCKQFPPNGYVDKPIKKGDLAKFKPWMHPELSKRYGVFIVLKKGVDPSFRYGEDRVYFKCNLGTLRATEATNVMLISAAPS